MKQEVYSCLKVFESFNNRIVQICNSGRVDSVRGLRGQYEDIRNILKQHLTIDQMGFIPVVYDRSTYSTQLQIMLIQELITASDITVSYLRSLDMNINKELETQKAEVEKKKNELEIKEKEIESYKKLLKDSLEAIKQYPELQRSRTVEEIKKSHRAIEENTRKKENN